MRGGAFIYNFMSTYSPLTDLVPTSKMFALIAQKISSQPYIVYREVSSIPTNTSGDSTDLTATPRINQRSILDISRMQISCFATTYSDVENIAVKVRQALDREWGALTNSFSSEYYIDSIVYDNAVDDYDEKALDSGIFIKHLEFTLRVVNKDISNSTGYPAYAISFDGVDEYATTSTDNNWNTKTYTFWAKSSDTGRNVVLNWGDDMGFYFNYTAGGLISLWYGNGQLLYWPDQAAQDNGSWNFWTLIVNGASQGDSKLYVNGVEISVLTWINVAPNGTPGDLKIGYDSNLSEYYDGILSNLAIFNGALSQTLITQYYNSGTPSDLTNEGNLLTYYKMDEGSGSTLNDSKNNNSALLINSPTWTTDTP
jgi:hypothetical protein